MSGAVILHFYFRFPGKEDIDYDFSKDMNDCIIHTIRKNFKNIKVVIEDNEKGIYKLFFINTPFNTCMYDYLIFPYLKHNVYYNDCLIGFKCLELIFEGKRYKNKIYN